MVALQRICPSMLLSVALSFHGLCLALAGSSSQRKSPWWENDLAFKRVDKDYSWLKRNTGVTPFWKPALGIWTHYRQDGLQKCPAVPWTSGRMCKSLQMLNASAFQLHSVYESKALGLWLEGFLDAKNPNRPDGLSEHSYTFQKTPYRVNPMMNGVDSKLDFSPPSGFDTQRATIVQPDAATFSGPRWLPPKGNVETRMGKYWEMWLAESLDGSEAEDRKIGLFLQYDEKTGEFVQLFRMSERALKGVDEAFDPTLPSGSDEAKALDLPKMERSLLKLSPLDLKSPAAKALIRGDSIERVVELGGWRLSQARVVRLKSLDGAEDAFELDLSTTPTNRIDWWNPANIYDNESWYLNCRFGDGAYARVPRTMDPNLDNICLEFGCLLANQGGFHRLLAIGSRQEGCLHTTIYERWEPAKHEGRELQ